MFLLQTAENGIVFLRSTLLSEVRHGFSTRVGGVSTAKHTASLNLSRGRGDDDGTVLENIRRFGEAVGFRPEQLVSLPQVHSDRILPVTADRAGEGVLWESRETADGYLLTESGVFAAVKTADCVPVLLYDPVCRAAAALHAGWRGTFAGIVPAAVAALCKLGSRPENILAAIGPAISGPCYEVGAEVRRAAESRLGAVPLAAFRENGEGRFLCDLKEANRLLLLSAEILPEHIDVCPLCTHCRGDLFYSHRASGGRRGTMMSVVGLP